MVKPPRLPPKKPPPRPRGRGGDLAEVPLDRLVSALADGQVAPAGEVASDEDRGAEVADASASAEGGRDEDASDEVASAEGASDEAASAEVASDEDASDEDASDEDASAEGASDEGPRVEATSAEVTGAEGASDEAANDEATSLEPPIDADEDEDAEARRVAAAAAGVTLADEIAYDPEDDLREIEGEASPRLVSIVESLIFAAPKPVSVSDLRRLLQETSKRQIQLALRHLIDVTRDRGVVVAQVAGGFMMRTHHDNAAWVQRLLQAKPVRLSRSQLETLAIIAYRQPVTRPEIDEVRGVDSGAVLKALLERELIQIVGKKDEPGRPLLYGTTHKFLEFFGLRSLRDLPTLRDFRELSEESKATLRRRYGEAEAAALGQEVIAFSGAPEGENSDSAEGEATGAGDRDPEESEATEAGDRDPEASEATEASDHEPEEPEATEAFDDEPEESEATEVGDHDLGESEATEASADEPEAPEDRAAPQLDDLDPGDSDDPDDPDATEADAPPVDLGEDDLDLEPRGEPEAFTDPEDLVPAEADDPDASEDDAPEADPDPDEPAV